MTGRKPGPGESRCPICQVPTNHAVRPFCSARCADIDLGRWVSGAYVIGGDTDAEEDGELAPPGPADDKS